MTDYTRVAGADATAAFRELTVNHTSSRAASPKRAEASAGPSPKKRRGLGSGPTLRARAAPSPPPELPDLHDLLTEFGRIELNADLLRAIQRTESHASLGAAAPESRPRARAAPRALLDRAAFERVVAAAKLRLVADMRRLREASEDDSAVFLRAALRQYAMRAVAACAKQGVEGGVLWGW